MKNASVRCAFVLLLCWLSANTLLAQSATGYMLFVSGSVLVNGKLASGATSVTAGDTIETLPGSVAKISAPGVSMLLAEKSKVAVGEKKLSLTSGSAIVSANRATGTPSNLENLAAEAGKPATTYTGCSFLSISSEADILRISGMKQGSATVGQPGSPPSVSLSVAPCASTGVSPKVWVPIAAAEAAAIGWVLSTAPSCFANSNQPISVTCPR